MGSVKTYNFGGPTIDPNSPKILKYAPSSAADMEWDLMPDNNEGDRYPQYIPDGGVNCYNPLDKKYAI